MLATLRYLCHKEIFWRGALFQIINSRLFEAKYYKIVLISCFSVCQEIYLFLLKLSLRFVKIYKDCYFYNIFYCCIFVNHVCWYWIFNYTLYNNAGFWLVNSRDIFYKFRPCIVNLQNFFLHVQQQCRCICIRFNFFSWYLQNRICRFYPSPRRL